MGYSTDAERKPPGSLITFLFVTFAWSWLTWGGVLFALDSNPSNASLILPWILLGAWGPSVAAVVATALASGRVGVKGLLRRYVIWRVGAGWYLLAILLPTVFLGIGVALTAASGTDIGAVSLATWPMAFVYFISAIPTGALAEELGWRGYLLPKLLPRHGAAAASLLVGFVHFSWHIPLFWAPTGTPISGESVTLIRVVLYAAFAVGISFVFTWLHENTRGSVLIAVLLHASLNAAIPFAFLPDAPLIVDGTVSQIPRFSIYFSVLPISFTVLGILFVYGTSSFSRSTKL